MAEFVDLEFQIKDKKLLKTMQGIEYIQAIINGVSFFGHRTKTERCTMPLVAGNLVKQSTR
jgi:hypothetical protein